ncbi:MAG TPA: alpha/beta family hydrolase [Nitrospiraceae bacterium]|nr:alpha/beta family hydrolase [Nitrospiraceae bacterium]
MGPKSPRRSYDAVGHEFAVGLPNRQVRATGLLVRPERARWLLVLAHGAGAGMRHPFMETLAQALAQVEVATFRYEFPYMQDGRGRPDPPTVLTATVRAAIATAATVAADLPLLAGGKSLGGRMTSQTLADAPVLEAKLPSGRVHGLVFFGFPLHPPGRPGTKRADHLARVGVPMLFLQGTRDSFADLALLRPLCASLGSRATLHIVDTADHSFHVLKRSGTTDADVLRDLARTVSSWASSLPDRAG